MLTLLQVTYPLKYILSPSKVVQKSKKQSKASTEGNSKSSDDFKASEKEFNLQWLK